MTSIRANQLMSSRLSRERVSVTHSVHRSPEAVRVTEQCSGNITKTLLNFCLPLSPFMFPPLSLLVSPLPPLPPSPEPEPAERATQIQQLWWPSLA
ncbi:hypothetical protein PBY51_010504 [Eleginops maclovinus]|nr:hypothetical protein PBY51_010504 [Eleginops maclovinus]